MDLKPKQPQSKGVAYFKDSTGHVMSKVAPKPTAQPKPNGSRCSGCGR